MKSFFLSFLCRIPCENLNDFLKCFDLPLSLLQTEEALEEAVYLILSETKEDGVIYAELRFAPAASTEGNDAGNSDPRCITWSEKSSHPR